MEIKYEFANGEVSVVEVDDEWAAVLADMDRLERNNDKKEKRRHTTLDNGYDDGEWLAVEDEDIAELFRTTELIDNLRTAISRLNDKQKKLVKAIYFDDISVTEYAKLTGVTKGAISQQLKTARQKIKKLL